MEMKAVWTALAWTWAALVIATFACTVFAIVGVTTPLGGLAFIAASIFTGMAGAKTAKAASLR